MSIHPILALAVALAVALAPAAAGEAFDPARANERYQSAGKAVLDMVNAKQVDAARVAALVLEMQHAAVPAARAYAARHPQGAKLIEATISAAVTLSATGAVTSLGPMKDLAFDQIQHQWHDLNGFKVAEVGIDPKHETFEHFTDPLHAIIHPIMVLRAAVDHAAAPAAVNLERMKAEQDEGNEQMEKLAKTLAAPAK